MLTGWVTDVDGNIYYLNPASDGTRGMMLIGWQQIDGKWYYFSVKGSYRLLEGPCDEPFDVDESQYS